MPELAIGATAFYDERHGLTVYIDNRDLGRIPPDGRLRIVGAVGGTTAKRQPTKREIEEKRMAFLAMLRSHPTLASDLDLLAACTGLHKNTVRKWLDEERAKYNASRTLHVEADDD